VLALAPLPLFEQLVALLVALVLVSVLVQLVHYDQF
jgi:hypothetical protein